ncbi:hypothetical protein C8R45DRAFT_1070423, partial [Mycena sanguinolenta]
MTDSRALDWFRRKKLSLKPPASTAATSVDDTPTKRGNTSDWVIDAFTLALELTEQALNIEQVAPFIRPAAPLLHRIIEALGRDTAGDSESEPESVGVGVKRKRKDVKKKAAAKKLKKDEKVDSYKDWKDVNENRLLAQQVVDLTGDICATVLRLEETNHSDQISRLKQDFVKYTALIEKASHWLKDSCGFSAVSHTAINKLNQELELSGARFMTNRLVQFCLEQTPNIQTRDNIHNIVYNSYAIPPVIINGGTGGPGGAGNTGGAGGIGAGSTVNFTSMSAISATE